MMHTFTAVPASQIDHVEILENEKLIVVEYKNGNCYHSTFVVMQENVNTWMMPLVIDSCPTLDSVEHVLLAIGRGRELAKRLGLPNVTSATMLMKLGSIVYDLIDEITHELY